MTSPNSNPHSNPNSPSSPREVLRLQGLCAGYGETVVI